MKLTRFFSGICLILTIFSLLLPHQNVIYAQSYQDESMIDVSHRGCDYDALLQWIENVEEGDVEAYGHWEDVDQIRHFIARLAAEGATPSELESMQEDIQELLEPVGYASALSTSTHCSIVPAIFHGKGDVILCKSFAKKMKHFVKKHKKALIIGAAVVVATVVVVAVCIAVPPAAPAIASSAVGAAGGAISSSGSKGGSHSDEPLNTPLPEEFVFSDPATRQKIDSFKEHFVQEKFLDLQDSRFPMAENGRILGRVFAHEFLDSVVQPGYYPSAYYENNAMMQVDQAFAPRENLGKQNISEGKIDFYELRGERALELGYPKQAIADFSKLIDYNPTSESAYLARATAHLQVGDYESSMQDYEQYLEKKGSLENAWDFSWAFAKAVPYGVKDSGKQMASFIKDLAVHPIDTGSEVAKAFGTLAKLVYSQEWVVIRETLAPEVCDIVSRWDSLSSEERGELSGYAFGKYGADILLPVASAKVATTGVLKIKEVATACNQLKIAERALVLEAAVDTGASIAAPVQEMVSITAIPSMESLLEAGKAMDRGGLTKAGRGLAKHGNRPVTVFDKAFGNAAQINEQGQKILEKILLDKNKNVKIKKNERYGKVIDVFDSEGRGVRYSIDGNFIGFLEP